MTQQPAPRNAANRDRFVHPPQPPKWKTGEMQDASHACPRLGKASTPQPTVHRAGQRHTANKHINSMRCFARRHAQKPDPKPTPAPSTPAKGWGG
eukprot:6787046-Alexandrium_andersonii.AAC.1